MNRSYTVMILCCLLLLADGLCISKSIEFSPRLSIPSILALYLIEAVSAVVLTAIGFAMFRRNYSGQKIPAKYRKRPIVLEPLRRLFVSVWS